jgi:PAS domain-containing protein
MSRQASQTASLMLYSLLLIFSISWCIAGQVNGITQDAVISSPETTIPSSYEILYGGSILLVALFIIVCVLIYEEIKVKWANAKILKEKDLLSHLIANIPIGICAMDAQDQRKYLIFNNKLGNSLGVDPKKVLGTFFPLEPLRVKEQRGESLSARCIRTRSLSESEITYVTPSGNKTFYTLSYPTFDENDALKELVFHYVDRTEERAWERELESSLVQFKSFFEQDIVAIGLYEAVYDNENVISFHYIDINSEYERLIGISRDELLNVKITTNKPYFNVLCQVLSEKKAIQFQNWYSNKGNKYLSGYVFLFDASHEYLCVTAIDMTHIMRLQKNKQMLLKQINANFHKLSALNTEMRQPLYEMQEVLANEEDSVYTSIIKEQLNVIITSIDELERGFIKSEKIQMYLMRQDNIVLDVEVAQRSILP